METIVGIDLGTTNSAIAIMEDGVAKIIPNVNNDNTTPSVVAFINNEEVIIGKQAKNQAATNPTKTISSAKRIIGRRVMEIPDASKKVPYTLVGHPKDPVQILVNNKTFLPHSVSAKVLSCLKQSAEEYLGKAVKDAVITVPAYFNDGQRQATKKAGELAGLNVKRIINEPTAAALAYGINSDEDKKIAVFDLGGGTFDISILEIGSGVWEVKSTNGDTFLGGDDFDREIVNLLARYHLTKSTESGNPINLKDYPGIHQQLKDAAETAKHELSENAEARISFSFAVKEETTNFEFTLTREKFDSLIEKYLKRIETCCKQALRDADLSANEINDVVLVGGSTRIPCVRALASNIFKKTPDTSVNPDEVVALGAAIQGAILSGEQKGMVLIDVTPLSLGLETEYGLMDILIPRNTQIPCNKKDIYTTTDDDQEEVDVYVYQGESRHATKNRLLGRFVLDGIEPAFSGDPQIEVRFAIDADGILQVSARNIATGSEQHITIKGSSVVSEDDIEKLKNAALDDEDDEFFDEYYDDDDDDDEEDEELDLEDLIEVGESLLKNTAVSLEEIGSELSSETIGTIRVAKENLAEALDEEELDDIQEKINVLLEIWDKIEDSFEED
jgi:molecular chaperone DnaK